jgi:hypothetical protein
MCRYSLEERVFIVKTYWTTGFIKNCQRFVEQFGGRNPPLKRCIQLIVKNLETKGTLLDLHGGGRPEMSENTVHDIENRLLASPRKSLHVLSQEIGLSRSTCQRAAKKAGLHAYRFRVVQKLKQQDYNKRTTYCRWFQTFNDENPGILDCTWFSDEAWFHLSRYVNSQNTRLCGSENTHALFEEPLHSQKVSVFCALSQRHYDVKAYKHLASLLTTNRQCGRIITAANNWAHVL